MPKVSVIVNCHNGEAFLKNSLNSIFNQSFKDWEIIFFNNASNDKSEKIAESFGKKIKIFNSSSFINLGKARAEAVSLSTGEWLTFIDTDDLWMPNKLDLQLSEIDKTDFALGYAGVIEIDERGKAFRKQIPKYSSGNIFLEQLKNFEINMVTPIINANFLAKHGLNFDHRFTASEEYNLFMKICAISPVKVQKQVLGSYRVYEESLTNRYIKNWATERFITLDYLKINHEELFKDNKAIFEQAFMRGDYYKSRYLFSEGRIFEGRQVLRKRALKSIHFFLLYLLSFSNIAWKLAHQRKFKNLISKYFNF